MRSLLLPDASPRIYMKMVFIKLLGGAGMMLPLTLGAQTSVEKAPAMPNIDLSVQHLDTAEEVKYPWGSIRWLMSSKIDHGSAQTFGIVQINPGQHNALHSHPNCEELLYVLSGTAEHVVGNKRVTLRA